MLREGIISSLEKFATILEFKKESPFKIRAYLNAVERIRGISEEEFERLIVEKKLESIEGIGKALAAKITEYYETGKIEALIRVLGEVPPGLFELLKIRGLGSAQIRELHEKLGISDVSELEYACRENRLVRIRGFGEKKQANILSGIEFLKGAREFQLFIDAETIFHSLAEKLKTIPGVGMVVEGGALARKCEVVNCVDVSVLTEDVESLMAGIKDGMKGIEISSAGGILALRHPDFPRINIMTVGRDDFALKSLLFTCTESLGMALLRTVGAESLPRHNRRKDSPPARKSGIPSATESPPREIISREALEEAHKEIFRSAGLQYIPVELREDTLILETAAKFE
ncbi:MAG: hypothetical protein FJ088_15235, partial [Deltaproteobacteria bacterium]|nr:hypothetical protein [Deltaproteobacteria bacterium]